MSKIPTESEIDALLSQFHRKMVTLESLQELHAQERKQACLAMDEMATQFKLAEEKRKKLWGSKFPRVLGAIPPENGKTSNPVKKSSRKKEKRQK